HCSSQGPRVDSRSRHYVSAPHRRRRRIPGALSSGDMSVRDVLIIGAGPSGLSAAIACKQRGLDYQVLEQGVLVNSIFHFPPPLVFFTTPELLEIGGLPFFSPLCQPTPPQTLDD